MAAKAAHIGGDKVDLAVLSADGAVERARPNLRISGKLKGGATNIEEQALKARELICGDRVEADVVVEDGGDSRDVSGERVWGSSVRSPTSTGSWDVD